MSVSGWVWQENVLRLMRHLASITGYEFDSLDADAVETGLLQTDAEEDAWFDYPICGSPRLDVSWPAIRTRFRSRCASPETWMNCSRPGLGLCSQC